MFLAFERYFHDLNTSKIINQPLFYEKLEKAKETIKNMDDEKLLSAYDDFTIPTEEIEKDIKKANYFNFTDREDLTKEANEKLSQWYKKNRDIYIKYIQIPPSHIELLASEAKNELDRRGLLQANKAPMN